MSILWPLAHLVYITDPVHRAFTFQHGPALTEMAAESWGHSTVWSSLQVTSEWGLRESRQRAGPAKAGPEFPVLSYLPQSLMGLAEISHSAPCTLVPSKALTQACTQEEHTHVSPGAASGYSLRT